MIDEIIKRLDNLEERLKAIEKKNKRTQPPTLQDAINYASEKNYLDFDVQTWYEDRARKGWEVSKGKPIKNWQIDLASMARKGYFMLKQQTKQNNFAHMQ